MKRKSAFVQLYGAWTVLQMFNLIRQVIWCFQKRFCSALPLLIYLCLATSSPQTPCARILIIFQSAGAVHVP